MSSNRGSPRLRLPPAWSSRERPGCRGAFPRGGAAGSRRKRRGSPRRRRWERSSEGPHVRQRPEQVCPEVGQAVEEEIDGRQRMNMALVFLPIPHQPRRKVILSGRGSPPGLQEVVIDAPVGHPPEGRGQLAGVSGFFPRVEDHRGRFLKKELSSRPPPRPKRQFLQPS